MWFFRVFGGTVLKYFLSETIYAQENGSRGTHFAKFLISNFLKSLTYSGSWGNLIKLNSAVARLIWNVGVWPPLYCRENVLHQRFNGSMPCNGDRFSVKLRHLKTAIKMMSWCYIFDPRQIAKDFKWTVFNPWSFFGLF